jgi:hypothetical protein
MGYWGWMCRESFPHQGDRQPLENDKKGLGAPSDQNQDLQQLNAICRVHLQSAALGRYMLELRLLRGLNLKSGLPEVVHRPVFSHSHSSSPCSLLLHFSTLHAPSFFLHDVRVDSSGVNQ